MNKTQSNRVEALVPTAEEVPTAGMAPRLDNLDRKVIGFLWNARPHGDELFHLIVDELKKKYQIKDTVVIQKPYLGNQAPKEIFDKLAKSCDAVITGIGD